MGAIIEGNKTYIRRLRVTSNERDALSLRLHLDRMLGSADLQPAGLPRSAVVCIRNLRVSTRLPFELRDPRFATEWRAAIATSLDQLIMRAARPAVKAVPVNASAVIFLDRAELLACLASDWCNGLLLARWWWQGLLRNDSAAFDVKDSWHAAPAYVPSALAHLARKGKAADFLGGWSNKESFLLLQRVVTSFALHDLMAAIESVRDADGEDKPGLEISSNSPWQNWVPEANGSGLGVGPQLLLSIGLLLRRAPALVRKRDFAREVRNWCEHISAEPVEEVKDQFAYDDDRAIRVAAPTSSVISEPDVKIDSLESLRLAARKLEPDSHPSEFSLQGSAAALANQASQRSVSASAQSNQILPGAEYYRTTKTAATEQANEVAGSQHMQINESEHISRFDRESDRSAEAGALNEESELRRASEYAGPDLLEDKQQIETRFGGLFYFINLGLHLKLYGDFTTPAAAGIELNIWDFVALVGEELVGVDDDPIWSFLARLAGRELASPPGDGFVPQADWRVTPEWLSDFATEEPWSWSTNDRRLRLAHPEGFLVLDLPLDLADPVRQLQAEMEKYETVLAHSINLAWSAEGLPEACSETKTHKISPRLHEWLSRLMPYLRARLRVALCLESNLSLAAFPCGASARVCATDTHIDVFFGLADLPLQIRFAGLDRDPGWVPAAGRFIAFHFD